VSISCAVPSFVLEACAPGEGPSIAVKREQLFTLGYGPAEDQLDLFQGNDSEAPQKTAIAMMEGIFYISDGAGAKLVRFTSWGDPLSMLYNPEIDSAPILLKPVATPSISNSAGSMQAFPSGNDRSHPRGDAFGIGREAVPYPFRSLGAVAVDSNQTVYVEDRLPPERRVQDRDSGALLDHVVLRFDKNGQFMDFLGQEGIGGTPFPYILGVYTAGFEDCVVVSALQTGWLVHWFDDNGVLVNSIKLMRRDLPMPDKGPGLIANFDKIVPDSSGRNILLKVDYYKAQDSADASAAELTSSWTYRLDLKDGKYLDRWRIPVLAGSVKGPDGRSLKYSRTPELLGAAGRSLFFLYADDDGRSFVSTFDRNSQASSRYRIDIAPDELYYDSYFLSKDGVLCALLASKSEAKIVWWRFDKLIDSNSGIVK
jgi:hypothetical protein